MVATYVNIASAEYAMYYQGYMLEITCILKEGNVTVPSASYHNYKGALVKDSSISFDTEMYKGSLVALSDDSANTAAATKGVPAVYTPTAGVPIIGIILSEPKPILKIPSATQTVWATILAGEYYRVAKVGLFCRSIIPATTVEGASNAISPGSSVIYDLSADGFVFGRVGLSEANSASWDGSGADTGANAFLMEPISIHYSNSNTGVVGIMLGAWPIRTQA